MCWVFFFKRSGFIANGLLFSYFLLPLRDFSLRSLKEKCTLMCRLLWGASPALFSRTETSPVITSAWVSHTLVEI